MTARRHRGDLFDLFDRCPPRLGPVLAVTTNCTRTTPDGRTVPVSRMGVMGAGCARAAALRYPGLSDWWGSMVHLGARSGWYAAPPGLLPQTEAPGGDEGDRAPEGKNPPAPRRLGCLVTKANWWEASTAELVAEGLRSLRQWCDGHPGHGRILLPLPGAGLGGLPQAVSWQLCDTYLDGRFVVCTL